MPCNDNYGTYLEDQAQKELAVVGPALCAVLSKLFEEQDLLMEGFLNRINWKEAGVKKGTVLKWWAEHKKKDAARRQLEETVRIEVAKKDAALAKLTKDDREALGLQ